MKKLNLMSNLRKIRQIRKAVQRVSSNGNTILNFRKIGADTKITPELLEKYRQGSTEAANIIAREILKDVHGAMKYYHITEDVPAQEWKDFRDKTAERIWEYTVPRYDPEQGKFSTLVFNMVNNMWKNWLRKKTTTPLDKGPSLDDPIGGEEEGEGAMTGMEMLQDPLALNFKSDVEAQIIESALMESIRNPKHKEILNLWLNEDPRMVPTGKEGKAEAVTEKYNAAHPESSPMTSYRIYRIMLNDIYPAVLDKFPEMAGNYGFKLNPEADPEKHPETAHEYNKWIKKRPAEKPVEEFNEDSDEEFEEENLLDAPAPAYRIDPQTGERVLISLNMRRKLTASQEVLCNNVLIFLSIGRHDKFRRVIKSRAKR